MTWEERIEAGEFIRIRGIEHCSVCGKYTNIIDVSFHSPICSEECERKITNDYFEALKK